MRGSLALAALALLACRPKVVSEQPEPEAREPAPTDARLEVRAAARAYADALAARDPQAAVGWVVPETFDFYEELRVAALRSRREQLAARDLLTLVMVLELRTRMSAGELEQLDGRGLFEQAIRGGLAGEGVERVALDEIWIDPEGRRAEVRIEGQTVLPLRRDRARGREARWRVDVPELIAVLAPAFEALAAERVAAEGKLAIAQALLEQRLDQPLDPAIFDGPAGASAP